MQNKEKLTGIEVRDYLCDDYFEFFFLFLKTTRTTFIISSIFLSELV